MAPLIPAYSTALMQMAPRMPMGRSTLGFLHSSAVVAMESKPTKEKKTFEAPRNTPFAP